MVPPQVDPLLGVKFRRNGVVVAPPFWEFQQKRVGPGVGNPPCLPRPPLNRSSSSAAAAARCPSPVFLPPELLGAFLWVKPSSFGRRCQGLCFKRIFFSFFFLPTKMWSRDQACAGPRIRRGCLVCRTFHKRKLLKEREMFPSSNWQASFNSEEYGSL